MTGKLTFRAAATLIVGGYAVIAALIVLAAGQHLGQGVSNYAQQISWLMPETTPARVTALRAAGRPETAALYALIASVSWGLISAMSAAGFAWGVLHKGESVLGLDKALTYLAALSGLYAFSTCLTMGLSAAHLSMPRDGLHAIPGLWFATMIPSAAVLARCAALIAHDAGSLLAIVIAAEPRRLAQLVEATEAARGADSVEARLARRIAAVRVRA